MKINTILLCLLYAGFVSCGQGGNRNAAHDDHSGHDHSEHAHDHLSESHGPETDHDDHDHEGHDHSHDDHGHDHNHEGHDHEGHDHAPAEPASASHSHENLIELDAAAARAAGITAAPAQAKPFLKVIPAIGEILPMPGDVVTVTAKNEGFVLFDAKRMLSGTPVSNGEKVLVITSQGITQDNYTETLLQAEIAYNNAKQLYERNLTLHRDQLVTLADLQNSEAAFKTAELRYNNLRTGFEKDGLRVTAPTGGFVTDMLVGEGDYVTVGQPLFTVSKNRNVMLRAEVSPEYMRELPKVVSANFRTSASGPFLSTAELGGRVSSYGRSVESGSLLVPVYISIPYSADYPAGSYAEIKLLAENGHGHDHIVLPSAAIVEDFGHFFVYVADEHGYERRDVRIGGSDGIRTEILSGIREGENVVVTGATRLKLVERLGSLGAEAAHAGHSH